MEIRLKRAYEEPEAADGRRVLVDRIWSRGLKKEDARLDWWAKDLAPTNALRRWFGHDPEKWQEFKTRYFRELTGRAELLAELRKRAGTGRLTLVYGAKDQTHNNAVALKEYLEGKGLPDFPLR